MAFVKKTWKDRLVEFANRRILRIISGGASNGTMAVDIERDEGIVSQAGDAFSAANMNDLEQRIADGFAAQNQDFANSISDINSKLVLKDLTYINGSIDFASFFRIDVLIMENIVANAKYTINIIEPSQYTRQNLSILTSNLNYMYACTMSVDCSSGTISIIPRMGIRLDNDSKIEITYTILKIVGYPK